MTWKIVKLLGCCLGIAAGIVVLGIALWALDTYDVWVNAGRD